MKRKLKYPRNDDIAAAIIDALSKNPLLHPSELFEKVVEELEEKKFFTGLVNPKRVWRVYENMVKKGMIYDVLDVVKKSDRR